MNEIFTQWLASGDSNACHLQVGRDWYIILRVEKNADFDYLFSECQYRETGLTRQCSFDYSGIYCKRDGLIYNGQYNLRDVYGEDVENRSAEKLFELLKKEVRQLVERRIGNDRRNLRAAEITGERDQRELEHYRKYGAARDARDSYLSGGDVSDIAFRCRYEPDRWTEDSLLDYILDPDGYTQREVEAYLEAAQEDILLQFLENDALIAAYQALVERPESPVHIVKKIMDAMNASSAKMVNVTIRKEGEAFTFKTEAAELRRDCTNHYSTWNIAAADRRAFEKRFGRSADYSPEEIVRITYARNVLYQAEK